MGSVADWTVGGGFKRGVAGAVRSKSISRMPCASSQMNASMPAALIPWPTIVPLRRRTAGDRRLQCCGRAGTCAGTAGRNSIEPAKSGLYVIQRRPLRRPCPPPAARAAPAGWSLGRSRPPLPRDEPPEPLGSGGFVVSGSCLAAALHQAEQRDSARKVEPALCHVVSRQLGLDQIEG
jgi:hypothetical protein